MGNGLSPSTRRGNRSLSLLIGFTGAEALLPALGGGFVYFGKAYLNQINPAPLASQTPKTSAFASGPEEEITTVTQILEEIDTENSSKNEVIESIATETESDAPVIDAPVEDIEVDAAQEELEIATAQSAPLEAETPSPEFDFKIQDFVDQLQIFGYRSAGADSRLLMNGRVYKLNDIVDNERSLKFIRSDGEKLYFEAPSGYRYPKPL